MKDILEKMKKDIDPDIIDAVAIQEGISAIDAMHIAVGWQQLRDLKQMRVESTIESWMEDAE